MSTYELEKEIARRLEVLRQARERRTAAVIYSSPQSLPESPVIEKDVEQEQSPGVGYMQTYFENSSKQVRAEEQRNDSSIAESTARLKTIIQMQNKQLSDYRAELEEKDQRIKYLLLYNATYRKQSQQPQKPVYQNTRQQYRCLDEYNIQLLAENKALRHQIAYLYEDHSAFSAHIEQLTEYINVLTQQNSKLIEQQTANERRLYLKNYLIAKLYLSRGVIDKNTMSPTCQSLPADSRIVAKAEPEYGHDGEQQGVPHDQNMAYTASSVQPESEQDEQALSKCMKSLLEKQEEIKKQIIEQQ